MGRPVNKGILKQFNAQKHRGTDGFGLFDGKMMNIVKATREKKIKKWLKRYDSNLIMFHHRYPTSTANVKRAAHPFSTGNYFGDTQYVLVHNGVIRNSDDLFCDHQELGIEYKTLLEDLTYNDSESLLWDFALYIEGKQKEPQAIGDMAFICLKIVNNVMERMYFYTNGGRPLNMLKSSEGIMLSSEGEGEKVDIDVLYNWNYKLKRLFKRKLEILERKPYVAGAYSGNFTPSGNYQRQSGYYPYADPAYGDDYYDRYGYDMFGNWVGSGGGYDYDGYKRSDNTPFTPGSVADKNSRDPAEDPQAYEDWFASKDGHTAGDWLGDHLREKFGQFFNADGSLKEPAKGAPPLALPASSSAAGVIVDRADKSQQVMDFERSKGGLYVPVNERKMYEKRFIAEKQEYPSLDEIQTECMAYLASVRGHFEQAYWAIEGDYSKLESKPQTPAVIRAKVLLDLCLRTLDDDPEYENEESVSSMWEAIWMQQSLAK